MQHRLAVGDSASFTELYDQIADQLFHYLLTRTGSREDAADILQETFIRLYRFREKLRDVENLTAYVFRVARNEMMRGANKNRPQSLSGELLFEDNQRSAGSSPETNELVAVAMNKLGPNFREVVELKIFARLTFSEIAEVMGKPPGTIATWYRRALDQMRNALGDELGETER
jgi:RNA polymerase sigma-70 factor (ECF subfamily)